MAANETEVLLNGKRLQFARLAWWALLLIYGTFFLFNTNFYWKTAGKYGALDAAESYLYIVCSLIALLFAIFLYWKKDSSWMAIFTSLMIIADVGKYSDFFWFYVIDHSWKYTGMARNSAYLAASLLSTFFLFIACSIIYYTVLKFPYGKWILPRVGWVLILWTIVFGATAIGKGNQDLVISIFLVVAGVLQIIHYFRMSNSIQRQQVKWMLVFWIGLILDNLAVSTLDYWLPASVTEDIYLQVSFGLGILNQLLYFSIFISLVFSIFRYRLWDIDLFINRAVVYSVLTGMLGGLGAVSLAVINFFIRQWFGEDSSLWAVIISVLPVAAAFNPLRDRVQALVDRYFKPEEVHFENQFLEFRTDIRNMLGTSRMIEIVSKQAKKQLNVDFAHIYLADENGKVPQFPLSEDASKLLANGELVGGENAEYSLLVPLVVTRPVFPDFVGILVLGRRLNGKGYSTPILNSLKILGANAGEAIYLSQLNEQVKQGVNAGSVAVCV